MTPVKHIVFDIGQVLIHYEPDAAFRSLIPDADERKWFFDNVCTSAWNIEQDRGRKWEDAEALLIADFPDREQHIRAFRQNWHLMITHSIDGSVEILRKLIADGHDVTMLTNFASDTLREAWERFPFLTTSRGVTVSGDIGYIKPDREIYDRHVAAFDLDPAATLFIDDSAKNVVGARNAGWQAVQFIDPATLRADLARFGITV
ncbi:HAD family phosphatase [Phyllobacterium sp. 0TCS1.6C]|uniref:HAD family hydrolase n=1 Tax=unclassified Phyllobacterium TaxID=2638441 RepID=UPI002265326E|nr:MULTISPECIES: HAD family phosphatase [unclassified Phyllobacterium]MCX8281369.1 HAD family phosphatase [Phyllobacterium sp. 0TCS1.6C]MCX8295975.1 HAD family phosphatase [Phyllobacterium sp. 0TCS1.6A]